MNVIKTQLAIIGGGPAGVCAALAAARRGMNTILVTNRPVLGGNSSSEIRVWSRGASGAGNLYSEEMGIWGELRLTNLYRNPDGNPIFWDDVLLDTVLKQENLQLLLNTNISCVTMDQNRIWSVSGDQQGTEKHFQLKADMYIDATGDGLLGALAGIPYYMGTEYIEFNERRLNDPPELQGCSILFYSKKEDHRVPYIAPDYAYGIEEIDKIVNRGGRLINEKMSGSDCWWFEYGGSRDTIKDIQDITLELKRLVMGVWNYIKNSGKFDAEDYTLEWIGNIPGKRESRRMKTEYMLTEEDIRIGRTFPDGAFYGGWYIDTHPSGGIHDSEEENCVQIPVGVYQIPLRCLYNAGIPNLIFAGRNIGAERQAFASSRIMNTCALSGQAAGELAAEAIRQNTAPSELQPESVEKIRLQLSRNDVFIPGIWIPDEKDIAAGATVSSSSYDAAGCIGSKGMVDLSQGGFVTFPGVKDEQVLLEVFAQREAVIKGNWYLSDLPNRLCPGESAGCGQWRLSEGKNLLALRTPDGCNGKFCTLELDGVEGVSIMLHDGSREGFLCGRKDSPEYHDPMLCYSKPMDFYSPERVVELPDRPWGRPNQWRAANTDQKAWLELRWDKPQTISQINMILDPDLNKELPSSRAKYWQESHLFAPRTQMPQHLIRSAQLQIPDEQGGWRTIAQFHENYQRLVKLCLTEPICSSVLRVSIDRTWGGAPAMYGLRVYEAPV